ncbi:hypothetical protein BBJ28_00007038 [Nothophytophthora sp. Chile5]|nr:hypothetical protein BBJ28_00007038 [Nothophytophthora sp. Chile5]
MPRRDTRLTVANKLAILLEADQTTVEETARRHSVTPSQIRRWRQTHAQLVRKAKNNPNARSINDGRSNRSAEIEKQLAAWIRQRRGMDIAVSTHHVISKALALDPFFKGGNKGVLRSWVYPFLHRNHLSIRRRTHVGQKLSGHLQAIRNEFVEAVNERFMPQETMEGTPAAMIVNMDETAVYYELSATKTINETGANTVSV